VVPLLLLSIRAIYAHAVFIKDRLTNPLAASPKAGFAPAQPQGDLVAKTTTKPQRAETAVRQYLTLLKDPQSLVDTTIPSVLERRLSEVSDPMDQLKIYSQIEAAQKVDEEGITRGFILHAKEFAKREKITANAFLKLGVPIEVLKEAGLLLNLPDAAPAEKQMNENAPQNGAKVETPATSKAQTKPKAKTKSKPKGGSRKPAVPQTAIIQAAKSFNGQPFTLRELENSSGSTPITVRKAIDVMLESKELTPVGPDPDYSARGRAPMRYQNAS